VRTQELSGRGSERSADLSVADRSCREVDATRSTVDDEATPRSGTTGPVSVSHAAKAACHHNQEANQITTESGTKTEEPEEARLIDYVY
jgi:hypothetical protein